MKLERAEYSPATITVAKVESLPYSADSSSETKKKTKNKRRFSDEQIKSLESMFESETKLEPRVKIQLARELSLHPRQIAIWFQNRRARCKSKELERDYSKLKANYDALASQFEILKKEKQSLLIQLQKLTGKPQEQSRLCQIDTDGNSTDGESDNGVTKHESEQKTELSVEGSDLRVVAGSDDDNSKNNTDYFGQEEEEDLTSFIEPTEQVLASSSVNWCSFDSSGFFDQSGSSAPWWEIWS